MNQYEMKKLAYQSNLRNRALQVLLYLIDRANKEQTCFPAVRTIARELHISVSTVKRAMQELVESGYVTKESRFRESNGGQTSNLYTLYFPKKVGEEWKEEEQEKSEPVSMKQFECKKAYAPLWFVRKSFMERDMLKAVQKYLKTESKVQIWCKDGEKSKDIWFCINEVLYIECRGHTLFIYTKNEECHKIYGSLKSLEEKLLVYGFIRIHKNFLVNARCVKEIGNRTVCLLDGMELDIGKNRRKQIKQQLENYKGGRRMC